MAIGSKGDKRGKNKYNKYNKKGKKSFAKRDKICQQLSFADCELAILRQAIDKVDKIQGSKVVNSPEIKKIISIVEIFLRVKNCICYGGTAINNILPRHDQFYDKNVEIPDYDFYSYDAMNHAKELVDIYVKEGFTEVEAKSGQHHGTYKVFVDFIPVADISFMPKELFVSVRKDAIKIGGIMYAPPNLLRMGMYLELSRPAGDVSRWEKVLKRLILLNKHYPLKGEHCDKIKFQQNMDNDDDKEETTFLYDTIKKTLVDQDCVFFGGFAITMYSRYMPQTLQRQLNKIPDFDVLVEDISLVAQILKERLADAGIKKVQSIERKGIGDIIAPHIEIKVGNDTVAFLYEPIACHSYNIISEGGSNIRVATIDTMLSLYLAFIYADRPYYKNERILCMAEYLFNVQAQNRLEQRGLLRRFSIDCVGHQETIEEMRAKKAKKFDELRDKKNTPEYNEWFLRYRPSDGRSGNVQSSNKTRRRKTKTKTKTKTRKTKTGFFFK